jgi:DNA-binding winged helix-turn-helix (wHTH) protein
MDLIRVGAFELCPAERRLSMDGRPVDLGSRAFDLLLVLVENAGRLVTKAVLIERVWPRLVVDENNLPAQVASLRRVLGAGAIRTVPRFGYRLDLPVCRSVADSGERDWRAQVLPAMPVARRAPASAGPLVGRTTDLEAVREALERERLVTLVGAAPRAGTPRARAGTAGCRHRPGIARTTGFARPPADRHRARCRDLAA